MSEALKVPKLSVNSPKPPVGKKDFERCRRPKKRDDDEKNNSKTMTLVAVVLTFCVSLEHSHGPRTIT